MNVRDIKMRKEEVALNSTSLLSFKVHEIDRYSPMSKELFRGNSYLHFLYLKLYLIARPSGCISSVLAWYHGRQLLRAKGQFISK